MDCTMVAAAPVLPAGYVVSASRIADRRMMLAGYRLADFLTRVSQILKVANVMLHQLLRCARRPWYIWIPPIINAKASPAIETQKLMVESRRYCFVSKFCA